MTIPRTSRLCSVVFGALLAGFAGAVVSPAFAVSITRARLSIDASGAAEPGIETEITLTESGSKPTTQVALYLAKEVSISSASLEGQKVTAVAAAVPSTSLRKWTLTLPLALASGSSRAVTLHLAIAKGNADLRVAPEDGLLLAGSGWFPSLEPNADALVPHSTTFKLAAGASGLAAGVPPSPGAPFTATTPTRPFAAWGTFEVAKETRGSTDIEIWRRPGEAGTPRSVDLAYSCWKGLSDVLGVASGSGPLRLVSLDGATLAGGQRTLFWNESRYSVGPEDPGARFLGRDVAVALVPSFWNDGLSFAGEDAAWLAYGIPQALADVVFVSTQPAERQVEIETDLFGSRRDLFLRGLASDRPLHGLVPLSPGASEILRTRGALVALMTFEAFAARDYATNFFAKLRREATGGVTREALLAILQAIAPNQHAFLPELLDMKELPDFRVANFLPGQGIEKNRIRIEIENRGKISSAVEVAIKTPKGEFLRSAKLLVPPGEIRAILMKDDGTAGIIEIDPRKYALQSDVSNDRVTLTPSVTLSEPVIGSYPVDGLYHAARHVTDFTLELEGLSITQFKGIIVPFRTFHGASGAALLGNGTVRIAPGGPQAAEWTKAMGREALTFHGSEMWVRFPLEAWPSIERQFGALAEPSERAEILERSLPIVEHSLPTFFYEDLRAQIPPPGSSLVTFTSSGGEMRGFVRRPLHDGRTFLRFWDQLAGTTIWEDTR